jgi:hypothetical protein
MNSTLNFPIKCISYFASNKNKIDDKQSFEWWFRGFLVRIISSKSFARGDILIIKNIIKDNNKILIDVDVSDEEYQQYPVLTFISSRLVYNKYSDFEFVPSSSIQILQILEQIINDNYSIGFIILANDTGFIKATDSVLKNQFDIYLKLSWS